MSQLDDLRQQNVARARRWHNDYGQPDADWTAADWSNAVCGEAGEMANVVKKLRRIDTNTVGANDPGPNELVHMLADEIADVIIYADLLADFFQIDLWRAIVTKFNAISLREGMPERLEL